MKTSEAIQYILEHDKNANKYRLSKALKVSHTTINKWLRNEFTMNSETYTKFKKIYPTINIDDVRTKKDNKLGFLV